MATEEQLKVTIQTVADTAAVERYGRAMQQVQQQGQQSSRVAEAAARATAFQRAGGMEAALRAAGAGPPGAGGAAGQITQTAISVRQLGLAFLGASTAGTVIHHVLQTVLQTTVDSIQAYRQYQRALPDLTTSANNLDTAFAGAQVSVAKLENALGRLAAPAVAAGLRATSSQVDDIAEALNRLPAWVREHNQPPFAQGIPALSNTPPFAPGAPQAGAAAITEDQFARQQQRLRQLNDPSNFPPVLSDKDRTDLQARLDWQDQIRAAATALNDAQNVQIGLQHQAVNLSAQEAAIRLSMLPTQERIAALQRDATENQLRARQAALPASEALEDVQYMEQRLRLQLQARGLLSPEERAGARRELRGLARAEPRVALGALDASRGVELAGRVAERADIEQQLLLITQERTLAQINVAQETNGWLRQIAEAREQGIQIQITLTGEGFMRDVEAQITSVFHTARMAAENAAAQNLAGAG
jgi:hypothetical protein